MHCQFVIFGQLGNGIVAESVITLRDGDTENDVVLLQLAPSSPISSLTTGSLIGILAVGRFATDAEENGERGRVCAMPIGAICVGAMDMMGDLVCLFFINPTVYFEYVIIYRLL